MSSNPYESEATLAEYLYFHYPPSASGLLPLPAGADGFPRRVVQELIAPGAEVARALDVGCAVGRSAFELTRHARQVVGLDFSSAFIAASKAIGLEGSLSARIREEGDVFSQHVAVVPPEIDRARVKFEVGDACALRPDLGTFGIVLAANLLCRLPDPMRFLNRLPGLVEPGGQLILATPFSWLREYTDPAHWLGAREGAGKSWDVLRAILEKDFTLEETRELPFLIREHARKYQYGISLGSRWRRH